MKQTIILTGTLGFIGSNFIQQVVEKYPEYKWVGIDKGVYDYCMFNMFNHPNYNFYLADIASESIIDRIFYTEKPSIVINMAAESFVCTSLENANPFLYSNVMGTQTLLNASVKYGVDKFLQISTDEVYGSHMSKTDTPWTEQAPLNPRNPYSASKMAAEIILKAAHLTHKLPFNITRCCNVYGPKQPHTRNLLPKTISNTIKNIPVPIYGNGLHQREFLFVEDKINAIMTVLKKGVINETYNIGSGIEFSNLEIVNKVAKALGKEPKIDFVADRKIHDFRYALNYSKIEKLGWKPQYTFDQGFEKTIKWYQDNLNYYGY